MGISRDSRHKRRSTGGKRAIHQKKRKHELGRPSAHTKLGTKRVHTVRVRGGNSKFRALRLDTGNFSWGSEQIAKSAKIMAIVYNATSNELVRTNTITKSTIVTVDALPFKEYYYRRYGIELGKKKIAGSDNKGEGKKSAAEQALEAANKVSDEAKKKREERAKTRIIDPHVEEEFASGRLLACISSRPGQTGRADGYILEGRELDFYRKKLEKKKKA